MSTIRKLVTEVREFYGLLRDTWRMFKGVYRGAKEYEEYESDD